MFLRKLVRNGFRAAGALLLTASGFAHAQVSISQLPPAALPLKSSDAIIVNQTISGVKTTRQSPLSTVTGGLTSHFVLQAPDPTLLQSRTLAGTTNQVIITDGGALGNLTLSLPQSIATINSPTFAGLTLTGALNGTSGIFSGSLSSVGYSGTTGTFSGALSALSLSLTNPLPATSGGTGFASYTIGDLLAADTTTTLSKLSDVSLGSYLRSGGVNTLPLWSTLKLPNSAVTGDIFVGTSANTMGSLTISATTGTFLRNSGTSPAWSTVAIPNAATLGDLWYGSASNVISTLSGNTTSTKQFLTQTGTGTVSAAPAWGTIAAGDLPGSFSGFANPTASIGLTTVNGAATTAMRSDAAPALSQAISPNWTGSHTFRGNTTRGGTTSQVALGLISASTIPMIDFTNSSAGTDQKSHEIFSSSTGEFVIQTINEAANSTHDIFRTTRGTGVAVSAIALGNATDNPAYSFLGSGSISRSASLNGTMNMAFTNSSNGTAAANSIQMINDAVHTAYLGIAGSGNTGVQFTGGPTGEQAFYGASGNIPVVIGTNSTVRVQISGAGAVAFPSVGTTASAANAFLDNAASPVNNLLRSTSSRRYKTDISTMTEAASSLIYKLRPVRFHSLASADDHHSWFYGLVAEEVASVEPSLIVKDSQGRPDGVQYDRLQVFMLPEVQKMHQQIQWLWLCVGILVLWNSYLTIKCRGK